MDTLVRPAHCISCCKQSLLVSSGCCYKQGQHQLLQEYFKEFQSLVQVLEHYGAAFGRGLSRRPKEVTNELPYIIP